MPRESHSRTRAVLAGALIAVGALLAPVAVIASWANTELSSTDRFVDALAPLGGDSAVQAFVAGETSKVIGEQLDLDGIAGSAIDNLGVGPLASVALKALSGSAAGGLQSVIDSGVDGFVSSDAFAGAWRQTVRTAHPEIISALEGDPEATLVFGSDGSISIQLGPIVAEVRQSLIDQGLSFASLIPSVDRSIVVAQSDALPAARAAYRFVVVAGPWLPVVSLAFLVGGILLARRRLRPIAILGAGLALALGMAFTLVVVAIGRSSALSAVDSIVLPPNLIGSIFDSLTADMRLTAVIVLLAGLLVAAVGWLTSPFARARSARSWVAQRLDRMHGHTPETPAA